MPGPAKLLQRQHRPLAGQFTGIRPLLHSFRLQPPLTPSALLCLAHDGRSPPVCSPGGTAQAAATASSPRPLRPHGNDTVVVFDRIRERQRDLAAPLGRGPGGLCLAALSPARPYHICLTTLVAPCSPDFLSVAAPCFCGFAIAPGWWAFSVCSWSEHRHCSHLLPRGDSAGGVPAVLSSGSPESQAPHPPLSAAPLAFWDLPPGSCRLLGDSLSPRTSSGCGHGSASPGPSRVLGCCCWLRHSGAAHALPRLIPNP